MIRFSLFGIPVEVQPFFWLMCLLLGGAYGADSADAILKVALFAVAAFISVLVHELGHALTGLKLGGGRAAIVLTTFGGLAINQGGRLTRPQRFWMIAAGPGAGFVFFMLILLLICLIFCISAGFDFTYMYHIEYYPKVIALELNQLMEQKPFVFAFVRDLLVINLLWGIINLLPIMPLDGGQITNLFVTPQRRVFLIGLIASGAMALLSLTWHSTYNALLFGFLAWENFKNMGAMRWR